MLFLYHSEHFLCSNPPLFLDAHSPKLAVECKKELAIEERHVIVQLYSLVLKRAPCMHQQLRCFSKLREVVFPNRGQVLVYPPVTSFKEGAAPPMALVLLAVLGNLCKWF